MIYANLLFLLLFLAIHVLSQTLIPSLSVRNIALLVSSLLLYLWAGPVYVLLLLGMTLLIWLLARQMEQAKQKRPLLLAGVVVPLLALLIFRYTDFFLGSLRSVFGVPAVLPEIVVPFGIGVYTLRLLSYLLEVYRGTLTPEPSYWRLLTYSSLLYGSSSGPLMRYGALTKYLDRRKPDIRYVSRGVSRVCLGIAKKYLLADSLSILLDQYLARSNSGLAGVPVVGLWLGVILSALRWYLLFSAYADVSIGLGLAAGIKLEENFNYPLCSVSMTGFLSKWFISVGDFFRDFVGRPLSDRGRSQFLGALVCYMLLGLWFGGSWTFLLWGLWAAVLLVLEQRYVSQLQPVLSALLGLAGIFLSFVLLSFTTMGRLGIGLMGLVGLNGNGFFHGEAFSGFLGSLPLILCCILFSTPVGRFLHNLWYGRFQNSLLMLTAAAVWETVWPLLLLTLSLLRALRGGDVPFLTF